MSRKILAIKAKSRLGMKYIPHGGTELNIGVEDGPETVLSPDFLQKIGNPRLIDFSFSLPEAVSEEEYYGRIGEETNDLARKIENAFRENDSPFVLTVGGDHSIASASLLSMARIMKGKNLGVIMFDSHGDIHLKGTSPTGNYHGMWLRPFWSEYDDSEIEKAIDVSFNGDQLVFIGNLLLEEEEINFLSKNNVQIFPSEKFAGAAKQDSYEKLLAFSMAHDAVHVSFDIDVFNTDLVRATGTPNPAGFGKEMIFDIIRVLKESGKISSLDLVEVNPKKDGSAETTALAQEVISEFLG